MNHYVILEIEKGASQAEIRDAYQKKALQYHPDRGEGNEEMMQEVNAAYEVLKDPEQRKMYDQFGEETVMMTQENELFTRVTLRVGVFLPVALVCTIGVIYFSGLLLAVLLPPLKVDDHFDASWSAAFSGLWIMTAFHVLTAVCFLLIGVFLLCCALGSKIPKRQHLGLASLILGLVLCCLVAGTVTLWAAVDNKMDQITASLVPFMVGCALLIVLGLLFIVSFWSRPKNFWQPDMDPRITLIVARLAFLLRTVPVVISLVLLFITFLLLGLRLDHTIQHPHRMIGVCGFLIAAAILEGLCAGVRSYLITRGSSLAGMTALVLSLLTSAFSLLTPILSALKFDGVINASLVLLWIPLQVNFVFLLLAVSGGMAVGWIGFCLYGFKDVTKKSPIGKNAEATPQEPEEPDGTSPTVPANENQTMADL